MVSVIFFCAIPCSFCHRAWRRTPQDGDEIAGQFFFKGWGRLILNDFHPHIKSPQIFGQVTVTKAGQTVWTFDQEDIKAAFFSQTQNPPEITPFVVNPRSLLGHHQHRVITALLSLYQKSFSLPIQITVMGLFCRRHPRIDHTTGTESRVTFGQ